MNSLLSWWKSAVIYQIYPRSFQDSNNDGVGDLRGIINRLDYLHFLQIDAIWISPIYPSPMADFGYDISDYCDIDPLFGGLNDFKELVQKAHNYSIKIILDLVPNHTSNEHPWFLESCLSKENPKRDWYIWQDPKPDGSLPNNWLSYFGGPAWTFDEGTGQYYLHQFAKEQPELNYRNSEVLEAMLKIMRFWLDLGIDGFRVDVIWLMMKDSTLRDEPLNPKWDGKFPHSKLLHHYTANLTEVHEIIKEMRKIIDSYPEKVMIGEIYLTIEETVKYYGEKNDECHIPLNHSIIELLNDFSVPKLKSVLKRYNELIPDFAWPNYTLGNHDQKRLVTRVGKYEKLILTMLFTLKGTIFTYYGEEIGMINGHISPDKITDPQGINNGDYSEDIGRDPERTPMQWDNSPNAGFTDKKIEPWLPVNSDYKELNVAIQQKDPFSSLNYYKKLVKLRKSHVDLKYGQIRLLESPENSLIYSRGDNFLIILNFSSQPFEYYLTSKYRIVLVYNESDCLISNKKVKVEGLKAVILKKL